MDAAGGEWRNLSNNNANDHCALCRQIEDAKFKDGEVAFAVTRERNGQKFTIKYKGKVSGDTIKGKTEFERNGEKQSRDWEAKREKKVIGLNRERLPRRPPVAAISTVLSRFPSYC